MSCNLIKLTVYRSLPWLSKFQAIRLHSCQHQRTKKRDRPDEKAWKAVVSIFRHQGAQLVLWYTTSSSLATQTSRQRPSARWAWQWISRTLHIVSSAVADTKMHIARYTVRLRCTLVAGPNSGECPCPFAIEYTTSASQFSLFLCAVLAFLVCLTDSP